MKRIKLVLDEVQWSIAKGILEEAGVPFSILNEQFSSLYPGPALGAFGREILVADEDYEKARERLDDFFK
ncbi:MAG TPA: DUF2007 domain-containing protein [Nitrospiria bacterium]|nr:DUF2007 domain-containing protein [Nitrospiria bacterium]